MPRFAGRNQARRVFLQQAGISPREFNNLTAPQQQQISDMMDDPNAALEVFLENPILYTQENITSFDATRLKAAFRGVSFLDDIGQLRPEVFESFLRKAYNIDDIHALSVLARGNIFYARRRWAIAFFDGFTQILYLAENSARISGATVLSPLGRVAQAMINEFINITEPRLQEIARALS